MLESAHLSSKRTYVSILERKSHMKITIDQPEIERAIRNEILGQIRMAEGMKMSIDLAATRGERGFTATIEISPDAGEGAVEAKTSVVHPTASATPRSPAAVRAMMAAEESEEDSSQEAQQERVLEPAGEGPAASEEQNTATVADRGIFRNMRRPTNS